ITVEPDGKSATLTQHDILPPLSKLDASAMVHIEKQSGSSWEPLKTNDKVEYETKAVSFTTGEAPNYVPWENIAYAYPIRNQYNFLPKEYRKGYMKLKIGQPYLFTPVDDAGKKWKLTASFNPPQGAPVEGTVSYEPGVAQINFDIPANLSRETIYTYSIMRSSADGESAANNVNVKVNTTVGADGDTTSVAQTSLKGDANSGISKEVIACTFRTSRYTTFAEKMSSVTDPRDLFDVATGYVGVIGQRFTTDETFDKFEIEGDGSFSTKPLILLKAGLNNSWLQTKILPLLYNGYPFAPSLTFSRDVTTTGGIPPLEAVRLYNNDDATMYKLEESAIKDGVALSKPGRCRFMYYLSYVAHEDYMEVLNKASRLYVNGAGASNTRIANLLQSIYPDLQGNIYYPVELQYRLPGSNYVSSTITKSIYYKL
ncbi:MAG TPA: hypothetical protein VJ720_11570, partial [Chitinophaga sp.]|nr:hypothetical protein [Chitinophaga sp.]